MLNEPRHFILRELTETHRIGEKNGNDSGSKIIRYFGSGRRGAFDAIGSTDSHHSRSDVREIDNLWSVTAGAPVLHGACGPTRSVAANSVPNR